jgi:hypothetical protein
MLLVTFHGGSSGLNNISAYSHKHGKLEQDTVLAEPSTNPSQGQLSELRAMVMANDILYVANGAKSQSTVLAYPVPSSLPKSAPWFTNPSVLIGPTVTNNQFTTSIAHPFGIAFENEATCFISNQDTNVVSQVTVSNAGQSGELAAVSAYLSQTLFQGGTFLEGTFVASQVGILESVASVTTVVDHLHGGLAASLDKGKVQNSVRDVAIANGMLFVCDEPQQCINLYSLTDGTYLGSSTQLSNSPTHLSIYNGGLYVSAGPGLYWAQLPASTSSLPSTPPVVTLTPIALTPPSGEKIGGISFDGTSSTVYVPFQKATGGKKKDDKKKPGGSIYSYAVAQQSQATLPVLSSGTAVVSSLPDTPEFVLYWSAGS